MRASTLTFKRAGKLRREMTLPEVLLWQALRGGQLHGLRFRRQHPMGPYILDFFCASARLAVEVDGAGHDHPDRARHDAARDAWLDRKDIRVLRLRADDLSGKDGLADVLQTIVQAAAPSTALTRGPPPP